jgi:hypothetical protein
VAAGDTFNQLRWTCKAMVVTAFPANVREPRLKVLPSIFQATEELLLGKQIEGMGRGQSEQEIVPMRFTDLFAAISAVLSAITPASFGEDQD